MEQNELITQNKKRAKNELEAGATIQVDYINNFITLLMSNGDEYYFQDQEAHDLATECGSTFGGNLGLKTYILAIAQNW